MGKWRRTHYSHLPDAGHWTCRSLEQHQQKLQESAAVKQHSYFLGRGSQPAEPGEQPAPCQLVLAVLFPEGEVKDRCNSKFKKFIPIFSPPILDLIKVILSLTGFVPLFNTSTDKQRYLQLVVTKVLYQLGNDI